MIIAEMIIPFILYVVVIAGKAVRRKDAYRLPVLPAIKFFRPIKIVKERKMNSQTNIIREKDLKESGTFIVVFLIIAFRSRACQ
jgi:hypothetical protein